MPTKSTTVPTLQQLAAKRYSAEKDFSEAITNWFNRHSSQGYLPFDDQPEIAKANWTLDALTLSLSVAGVTHFLMGMGSELRRLCAPDWRTGHRGVRARARRGGEATRAGKAAGRHAQCGGQRGPRNPPQLTSTRRAPSAARGCASSPDLPTQASVRTKGRAAGSERSPCVPPVAAGRAPLAP